MLLINCKSGKIKYTKLAVIPKTAILSPRLSTEKKVKQLSLFKIAKYGPALRQSGNNKLCL